MDPLPGDASKGLADDFPDLLFSGIAPLGKILRLLEPFADNPRFRPLVPRGLQRDVKWKSGRMVEWKDDKSFDRRC